MTKILINFTRKIVYLLWLKNHLLFIMVKKTQSGAFSFFAICTCRTFPLTQWEGGVVGAAP